MSKSKVISTDDILATLCHSVTQVLSSASGNSIGYSAMVQKISHTCMRPDISCFVLFDGGFSALVVNNFSAGAALEIYGDYLRNMGMSENELAKSHLSDDVANVLGELMTQIVGDFTKKVREQVHSSITQSQPKMMAINKQVQICANTTSDRQQARRVTFTTQGQHIFYLEMAMEKTEFFKLRDFDINEDLDKSTTNTRAKQQVKAKQAQDVEQDIDNDFMENLGL